jgi:hypothetical protein
MFYTSKGEKKYNKPFNFEEKKKFFSSDGNCRIYFMKNDIKRICKTKAHWCQLIRNANGAVDS